MTMVFTTDQAATGGTLPTFETLEQYETLITAISGLRGWWDASNPVYRTDVSGKCSQVNDRSGNGFHRVQATAGNRPPVQTDYWGALNGVHRDALSFDGTTDITMAPSGNVYDGTTVWSEFLVFRPTNNGITIPISTASSSQYAMVVNSSTQIALIAGGSALSAVPIGGVQQKLVAIGTYNYPGSGTVALSLDVNGVSAASTPALGTTAPGTSTSLWGSYQSGHTFKYAGYISEHITVKGVIDAGTIAMLKAYAAFKYR